MSLVRKLKKHENTSVKHIVLKGKIGRLVITMMFRNLIVVALMTASMVDPSVGMNVQLVRGEFTNDMSMKHSRIAASASTVVTTTTANIAETDSISTNDDAGNPSRRRLGGNSKSKPKNTKKKPVDDEQRTVDVDSDNSPPIGGAVGGGTTGGGPGCAPIQVVFRTDSDWRDNDHYLINFETQEVIWDAWDLDVNTEYVNAACIDRKGCFGFIFHDDTGDG